MITVNNPTKKDIKLSTLKGHTCIIAPGQTRDLPDVYAEVAAKNQGLDMVKTGAQDAKQATTSTKRKAKKTAAPKAAPDTTADDPSAQSLASQD